MAPPVGARVRSASRGRGAQDRALSQSRAPTTPSRRAGGKGDGKGKGQDATRSPAKSKPNPQQGKAFQTAVAKEVAKQLRAPHQHGGPKNLHWDRWTCTNPQCLGRSNYDWHLTCRRCGVLREHPAHEQARLARAGPLPVVPLTTALRPL